MSPRRKTSAQAPALPVDEDAAHAAVDVARSAGDIQQFVTFEVNGEHFGIALSEVREIIRMPDIVQIPLAPASLRGVANLRGTVLPITSLRTAFGAPSRPDDDATRVVVVQREVMMGFVVDRMASVIDASPDQFETTDTIGSTIAADLVRGVVKSGDKIVLVLDLGRLIQAGAAAASATAGAGDAEAAGASSGGEAHEMQLVSFEVAGEEYAFPIEEVLEIVQFPDRVSHVPNAPSHIVGIMTLRDRLLPLVSLREMFGMQRAADGAPRRIVVVGSDRNADFAVGVVMDTVKAVLRVNTSQCQDIPALIQGQAAELTSICRLDGGKRLVTVLSATRMFDLQALRKVVDGHAGGSVRKADAVVGAHMDADSQFVVFRLAEEEYAVPIEAVKEIVRVPENLTSVPMAPAFMAGVVNLRGSVLPVIDQRTRFALARAERSDRQRILVLTLDGIQAGFVVDQVNEVLKIKASCLQASPQLSAAQADVIGRVANLPDSNRMIMIINPDRLLADEDRSQLARAA